MKALRPSGASVNGEQRPTLQSRNKRQTVLPLDDTEAIGPNEVLALLSNIRDVLSRQQVVQSLRQPVVPKWRCRTRQCSLAPKCSMSTQQGLNGSLPRDLPAEQSAATVPRASPQNTLRSLCAGRAQRPTAFALPVLQAAATMDHTEADRASCAGSGGRVAYLAAHRTQASESEMPKETSISRQHLCPFSSSKHRQNSRYSMRSIWSRLPGGAPCSCVHSE